MLFPIQRLTRIAILASMCVGLRYAFAGLPNIQPISAIFFVVTLSMGLIDGWLVMALTMIITSFLLGFGPWVFSQILTFAVLMAIWSLIAHRLPLLGQTILATILSFLYGVIMDYSYGLLFNSGWAFVSSGLYFDGLHAVSTLCFYPIVFTIFRRFSK